MHLMFEVLVSVVIISFKVIVVNLDLYWNFPNQIKIDLSLYWIGVWTELNWLTDDQSSKTTIISVVAVWEIATLH